MKRLGLVVTLLAGGCAAEPESDGGGAAGLAPGVEAVSLLGDTLRAPPLPEEARRTREGQLAEARAAYDANRDDPDALIWYGRRTAYLGRHRDAIDIFSRGIAEHPADARMYRHRGHRHLTVRDLPAAIADLSRAAELVEGRPDEVEPDGLPNAAGIPTSTLQSNIWYHLGLAHYLAGDAASALEAYERCMDVSRNNDMMVATAYWQYMTLRRLGRDAEAAALLDRIDPDLELLENTTYHRLLMLFKGVIDADAVLDTGQESDVPLANATVGYGVGFWHQINGRPAEAEAVWRRTVAGEQWAGFGYLASEAELARMAA